jgi:hypothetical protein
MPSAGWYLDQNDNWADAAARKKGASAAELSAGASEPPTPPEVWPTDLFAASAASTLDRALAIARERQAAAATVEHLLFSLTEDSTAIRLMNVDLKQLQRDLWDYFFSRSMKDVGEARGDWEVDQAFRRVVQRAAAHVRDRNIGKVTSAHLLLALMSEEGSTAVDFLHRLGATGIEISNIIDHYHDHRISPDSHPSPQLPVQSSTNKKQPELPLTSPPDLPAQGIGPHVELNAEGIISFPPAASLDQEGNHIPRLRALHPDLCELARELAAALAKGNAPHAELGARVAAYASLMDRDLQTIDFRRLYAAGVRLANSANAAERAISTNDLPPLEPAERERLDSLLALHGPFIVATAAGAEALADEERYRRRPAEERRYRADAIAITAAYQGRNDLIDPEVAKEALGVAHDVGEGANPERSFVLGRGMVRNVAISAIGGAIGSVILGNPYFLLMAGGTLAYVGGLTINETIKNMKWFKVLTRSVASNFDEWLDANQAAGKLGAGLRAHSKFVLENEAMLRRLAGKRKELQFIHSALDWLKEHKSKLPDDNSPT